MDNKNFLLFIALAMVIILGWSYLARELGFVPAEPQTQTAPGSAQNAAPTAQQGAQPDAAASGAAGSAGASDAPQTSGQLINVDTPLYKAVIDSKGGLLTSFELKKYKAAIDADAPMVNLVGRKAAHGAPLGLMLNGIATWSSANWAFETASPLAAASGADNALTLPVPANGKETLRLTAEIEGMRVSRVFTFNADTYVIDEKVEINSPLQRAVTLGIKMTTESLTNPDESNNHTRVARLKDNSFSEDVSDLDDGVNYSGNLAWAAILSNYFIAAVCPAEGESSFKALLKDNIYSLTMEKTGLELAPNADTAYSLSYYLGPKKATDLEMGPKGLDKALDYGMFTIIAKPLIWLLKTLYDFVGNYGIAIILLTIIIKIALWPLSNKGYKSMEKMKKIQPLMAKLREKYKDDKQEMNKQVMQLYKTYGVSPMGGCLPMLLQLPIFIGLYSGLLNAIELRQAPFIYHLPFTDMVWLADLSIKDPYYITPIVMGLTMLIQQKITPSPADPMQAKIMMLMPVIFTVMFATFPSGLVVYWLTNNLISIAQQWWMLRNKS